MVFHVFKPKRFRSGRSQAARLYSGRFRLNGFGPIKTIALGTADKQVATERLRKLVKEIEREEVGLSPAKAVREAGQKLLSAHLDDLLAAKSAAGRDDRYLYELKNRVLRLLRECGWAVAKDVTAESFTAWRNRQKAVRPDLERVSDLDADAAQLDGGKRASAAESAQVGRSSLHASR